MNRLRIAAAAACLSALLAGCNMPRSATTLGEVEQSSEAGQIDLRLVDAANLAVLPMTGDEGFPASYLASDTSGIERLGPGDVVTVTIFETSTPPIFGATGGQLGEMAVDESGRIFVPHAGSIAVAGLTPSEARQRIASRLRTVVRDPQVDVRLQQTRSRLVSVEGSANGTGSYAIERGRTRLGELVGETVKGAKNPDMIRITLVRDGQRGSVRLSDLVSQPDLDVALLAGDRVIVEALDESVTVLGGAGLQGSIPIASRDFSVMDALGEARGLDPEVADPRAVFLIRMEEGNATPVVYQFAMQRPEVVALASRFPVHDKDALVVSNASFNDVRKVAQALSQALAATRNAVILAP